MSGIVGIHRFIKATQLLEHSSSMQEEAATNGRWGGRCFEKSFRHDQSLVAPLR